MCQVIHVEDLCEETRELLEEYADSEIVTAIAAEQCEKNWERGAREFTDYADLLRIGRRRVA